MNHVVTHGEDSVLEVELSPQELQAITQSHAVRTAGATPVGGGAPRHRNVLRLVAGLAAFSVIAVTTLVIAQRTPRIKPAVPASAVAAAPMLAMATAAPAPSVELAAPPVRFANPFDKKEVFEFPAGTSRAEARQKVAELLLKRAQERRPTVRRVASSVERRNS